MSAKYRKELPQCKEGEKGLFLTDGGLETVLIFDKGFDLPDFAAFPLLETDEGRKALTEYAEDFLSLAEKYGCPGFVLETPTWRASPDWVSRRPGVEDGKGRTVEVNMGAVREALKMRKEWEEKSEMKIVVSGNVGPRGDGYNPKEFMTAPEARDYHKVQISALTSAGADMILGVTVTYPEEALGICMAVAEARIPVAIGFTTETDGYLPCGKTLKQAITMVDADEKYRPVYYLVNCAHPDHFIPTMRACEPWVNRIWGLRCNASRLSHAELDSAPELDPGDPEEFGQLHRDILEEFPNIRVVGGCCGTDARHVEEVCKSVTKKT